MFLQKKNLQEKNSQLKFNDLQIYLTQKLQMHKQRLKNLLKKIAKEEKLLNQKIDLKH
jgi:hypothetical protein